MYSSISFVLKNVTYTTVISCYTISSLKYAQAIYVIKVTGMRSMDSQGYLKVPTEKKVFSGFIIMDDLYYLQCVGAILSRRLRNNNERRKEIREFQCQKQGRTSRQSRI